MRRPSGPLWGDRGFVALWAAQGVSQLGTQVSLLALPLAALYVLHSGPLGVALLRSFAVLPFLLFTLPAGVFIDRVRRRPLMIVADVGRALVMGSIPLAYAFGRLSLAQLYAVAVVHGILSVIFDVSYLSFLPGLVGRPHLAEANAKLLGTQAVAQVAGPSLAGALVGTVGAAVAIGADAVGFALSALFLGGTRGREPVPEPAVRHVRRELMEGLRYVFGQPSLRILAIWTSATNLFTSAFFALFIVYLARDLHLRALAIGLIMAVVELGFIAGAALNGRIVARFGFGRALCWPWLLTPLMLLTAPLAPRRYAVPVIVVGGLIGTFAGMLGNVNQLTLRQAVTPPRLLGRMNSVIRFMYWGTMPIGSAVGGVIASSVGIRWTLVGAATGGVLTALPVTFSSLRRIERLPEHADEDPRPPEPLLGATVAVDA